MMQHSTTTLKNTIHAEQTTRLRLTALVKALTPAVLIIDKSDVVCDAILSTDISLEFGDELIGTKLIDLKIPTDLKEKLQQAISQVRQLGLKTSFEWKKNNTNPQYFEVSLHYLTQLVEVDANKQAENPLAQEIAINFRDVTVRRQSEQALRDNLIRLQLLQQISTVLSEVTEANRATQEALGILHDAFPQYRVAAGLMQSDGTCKIVNSCNPEDEVSIEGWTIATDEMPNLARALDKNHIIKSKNIDSEPLPLRLATQLQSVGVKSILIVPMRYGQKLIGILALTSKEVRDWSIANEALVTDSASLISVHLAQVEQATQRNLAELGLRTRERYLRAMFESLPTSAWLIDQQGKHLIVTQGFARQLGKRVEQCIGLTVEELWPAPIAKKFAARDKTLLISKGKRRQEELTTIQGEPCWLDVFQSCILDEQGESIGIVGFGFDITERVNNLEKIRQAQNLLEQRVSERTAELSAVNEELEAFSYSVSHDLRAPLRAIEGFAELLAQDYAAHLDSTGQEYLKHVLESTQRMNSLITDLLQLAHMNRAQLICRKVNLSEIVEEIAQKLKMSAPNRQVIFNISANVWIECDADLMRIVLENLLGNAWKFASKKTVAQIEWGCFLRDNSTVYFVRDNGAGFDPSHADRMFGAFQRFHQQRDFEGSGIGLATVKRIIRRHGGQIWAEGATGQGACFYFTLNTAYRLNG